MLFSHPDVARDVSERFEPVWVSLRPVPQVTIDFGEGRVVRRTLHGNIATWICDAGGRALDVIPGVYTTDAYRDRLAQAALLAKYVDRGRDGGAALLRSYHAWQAVQLAAERRPLRLVERVRIEASLSKFRIESPLEVVLEAGAAAAQPRAVGGATIYVAAPEPGAAAAFDFGAKGAIERPLERAVAPDAAKREVEAPPRAAVRPVAGDPLLRDDVRVNETERRLAVHRLLAETGPVVLESEHDALTKRLYREVLHCDLDDPWLGLGDLLFGSYPFER